MIKETKEFLKRIFFVEDFEMNVLEYEEYAIENLHVRNRFYGLLHFYKARADRYKRFYYGCTVISITVPAVVMVFTSSLSTTDNKYKWLIAGLSGIASISAGVKELGNYHENWIRLRMCGEKLKSEFYKYITEVKPYDNKETKDSCFIFEMENIVDNENNDWLNLKNNKDKHENELTALIESLKNIDDIGNLGDIKVTINATIDKLIKEKEREIKKFQGYTN